LIGWAEVKHRGVQTRRKKKKKTRYSALFYANTGSFPNPNLLRTFLGIVSYAQLHQLWLGSLPISKLADHNSFSCQLAD